MPIDCLGHYLDNLGRVQHANLDGVRTDIADHRVDLIAQHLRGNAVNRRYAAGGLRRQRGDRGHAVTA